MRRLFLLLAALLVLSLALAACADEGDPAEAIEAFLEAKVASDADKLSEIMCKELEAQVPDEAASFASVKAELQDMSCEKGDRDGDYTLVNCTGEIVVDYGGEQRTFALSDTTYRAKQEDGEWKMCGEQ